jgi:phosphoglycolate phosphatase-like HAD superfamily hydrolase
LNLHIAMKAEFDVIAWDFDGTLADSRAIAFQRASDIAALFGVRTHITTMTQYREVFANLECGFATESVHKATLRSLHRLLMRSSAQDIRPFLNVMEITGRLKSKPVIVTAALRGTVAVSLGHYLSHFAEIHGAEDGSKTDALARHAKGHRILYVTDTTTDLKRCAEVSVPSVAVGWGYDSFDDLSAGLPSWKVQTPKELERLFTELNLLTK